MFESALLSLGPKRRNRRWYAFPIAVGLHLAAAALVLGAQYWQIGQVGEPKEYVGPYVTFAAPPPPPPPPGPSGSSAPARPEPAAVPTVTLPDQPVQPEEVTDLPDPEPSQEGGDLNAGGEDGGQEGGVPGGKKDGVLGGDPNSDFNAGPFTGTGGPAVPIQDAPRSDGPIQITARVKKPVVIESTRVAPRYSEAARRARLQGSVLVQAVIDERGNVTEVRVMRGLPMGLDQSAADAVSQWKFTPATLEGRPVKVYYLLTVYFEVK